MNKSSKCFGAKLLNRSGIVRRYDTRRSAARILMYHRVNTASDCLGLTVSPELFSQQLAFLADNYEVISLEDAVTRLTTGSLSGNCCVLTFDDGYRDNHHFAAPLLQKYNLPATIFVTVDAVETGQFGWSAFDHALLTTPERVVELAHWGLGDFTLESQVAREQVVVRLHQLLKKLPDIKKKEIVTQVITRYGDGTVLGRIMMTWSEVKELAYGGLITIGAHTMTHPILSRVPPEQAWYEIVKSKHVIEENVGKSVDYFAYPNGGREDISPDVISQVKRAGYRAACTTISGHNVVGSDPWTLQRIDVTNSMSTDTKGQFSSDLFALSLSGLLRRY